MDDRAFEQTTRSLPQQVRRASRKPGGQPSRTDMGTLVLHWVVAVAMFASLLTGLRISADAETAVISKFLSPFLPQGEVWTVHFLASLILFSTATTYLVYMMRSGLKARIALNKLRVLAVKSAPLKSRIGAINVALHWALYLLVLVLTATGAALYVGYGGWIVAVHAASALTVLGYTLLHIVTHFAFGGWQQIMRVFRPSRLQTSSSTKRQPLLIASAIGLPVAFGLAVTDYATRDNLTVRQGASEISLDGSLSEAAWDRATPIAVRTMQGANLSGNR
jgi:cytochrome b subunit of formate dehydrogenase